MKWMLKCEVRCELGLESTLPMLGFSHPTGKYEVHLRNLEMKPGTMRPLIEVSLIYETDHAEDDFKGPIAVGDAHIEELLAVMCLLTGSRFQIHRRVCIADWRTGITERCGAIFKQFGNPDIPQTILHEGVVEPLCLLLHRAEHGGVRRALHWFSEGIDASHAEDQFECFWFAIETLAVAFKEVTAVPDRCATCHEPLHCPKCNKTPTHRPYPKQVIGQLIGKFAPRCGLDGEVLFRQGNELRNALLHGEDISEAEARIGRTAAKLVDEIGRVARLAVLDGFARTSTVSGKYKLQAIEPSTFLHYQVQSTVVMSRPCAVDDAPRLDDFPPKGLSMDLIVSDDPPAEAS